MDVAGMWRGCGLDVAVLTPNGTYISLKYFIALRASAAAPLLNARNRRLIRGPCAWGLAAARGFTAPGGLCGRGAVAPRAANASKKEDCAMEPLP